MEDSDTDPKARVLRAFEGTGQTPTPAQAQKQRLATAMRDVIERLVTSNAPTAELTTVAERLEQYAAHLQTHPRRTRIEGYAETANAGSTSGFFDYSPLIGRSNPLAPPIELRAEGEVIHGRARFGQAYEGPPGHVHGGFVAASFDEVLGLAQSLTGNPGMTGTLRVVYRRPTPLHTELTFKGWVDRVEGRKIFAAGELHAGETLCAEATGIFISMGRDHFRRMAEASEAGKAV